jgi:hypothetical protein
VEWNYHYISIQNTFKTEEKKLLLKVEPEKPVLPAPEPIKEMTLIEKILKVENLQLVIEK